ncbi:MAG: AMP-binding protein [Clostridia bacterium]|nr:AMP-binding protein [Clostridia bacterium]
MKKYALREAKEFTNVRELCEWAGAEYRDRIAYSFRGDGGRTERVTFEAFRDDVRGLATKLIAMGCSGKQCVLIGKCSYEWIVIYYAVLSVGAVLVPLDRDWQGGDLADTAKSADAEFLFCDNDIKEKGNAVAAAVELSSPVIYLGADGEGSLDSLVSEGKKLFEQDSAPYFEASIDPVRMSLLVFTSGTTGKGKGVMLSQNAILSDMSTVIPYIDFSEKTVGVLPPHHTYGSTIMFIGHVMIGSEVYISSGIRYVQRELKAEKPGHIILVPLYLETFYRKIWANIKDQGKEKLVRKMIKVSNGLRRIGIDQRRRIFGSILEASGGEVKTIISGGAPINPEIIHFFESVGISVLNGYGITECAPLISVNYSKNVVDGSVGNVIDIDTVKIDEPNEDGEGEILVKGPNVMLGYYKNQEATADAFKNGYFRTGDYGKTDKNGVLYITGRKKNLIILSNGKNVYPEEIENELVACPGIQDIIVYEGQSRRGLEYNAIVAEVYPDKDYLEKNGITDIKAHIRPFVDEYNKTCAPYKKIAVLRIREDDFPKNTLRKIMRFKLDTTIE